LKMVSCGDDSIWGVWLQAGVKVWVNKEKESEELDETHA
jgi:hypothetical protein